MVGFAFDAIVGYPNSELENIRALVEEIETTPDIFMEALLDRLKGEVARQEESLIDRNLCPKCENKLNTLYTHEQHEIWGHRQLCRVPDKLTCSCCGWKED